MAHIAALVCIQYLTVLIAAAGWVACIDCRAGYQQSMREGWFAVILQWTKRCILVDAVAGGIAGVKIDGLL